MGINGYSTESTRKFISACVNCSREVARQQHFRASEAFLTALPGVQAMDDHQADTGDHTAHMIDMRLSAMLCLAYLYITITIIGLTSNAAVLYMIARSRRSKAVTSVYIFNLAIADLLYVVCLPAAVYPMLNGHWILGHIMCKLYFTCDGVSKFASVMFLVVLSFDRYMAVCHPIASRAVRTAKVAFVASGASWLLVILAMIPVFVYATLVKVNASGHNTLQCVIYWPAAPVQTELNANETEAAGLDQEEGSGVNDTIQIAILAGSENVTFDSTYGLESNDTGAHTIFVTGSGGTDWARRIFTLYIFTLSFAAPLLLVWIFYIMIIHRLWTQKRTLFTGSQSGATGNLNNGKSEDHRLTRSQRAMLPANRANQRRRKSTKRVTVMVLSIVVAYTLCWVPYWCVQLTIEFFREDPALDFEIFTIISYIAYGAQSINSALNPFLYAFGTHAHRRRLLHWIRRLARCMGCDSRAPCLGQRNASTAGNGRHGPPVTRYRSEVRVIEYGLPSPINGKPLISASSRHRFLGMRSRMDNDSENGMKSPNASIYSFSTRGKPVHDSISSSSNNSYVTTRISTKDTTKEAKAGSQVKCCFKWQESEKSASEKDTSADDQTIACGLCHQ